jgi:hypothetical protein
VEHLVKLIDPSNVALALAIGMCVGLWRQNEVISKARDEDRKIVNDSLEKTTAALTAMTAVLHEVKTLILVRHEK